MTWLATTGSARGAQHVADGRPNEDHARVHDTGDLLVAAVADGHGAAHFPRAARASELATRAAVEVLPAHVHDDLDGLPAALVARWRELVAQDVAADPRLRGGEPAERAHYGTTLLAAAAAGDQVVLVQLGDGDVLLTDGDRVSRPVPDPTRTLLRSTDSLIADDAADRVRVVVVPRTTFDPTLVLLASDGLEAAVRHRDARDLEPGAPGTGADDPRGVGRVVPELLADLRAAGTAGFDDRVRAWCEGWASTGGDDATVAVLVRPALLAGG